MYTYNETFYRYIEQGSLNSARAIIPVVHKLLQPNSILDVGCGRGAWLSEWKRLGVEVSGIDGDYVDKTNLLIDRAEFHAHDLSKSFNLGRKFSIAECLEVAEHLPETSADTLIKSLCSQADVILFSAAPPGQGGENHINEQPYDYWRKKFDAQGFQCLDPFRSEIKNNTFIEPWYRYNLLLFIRSSIMSTSYQHLNSHVVSHDQPIHDVSPKLYQIRKRVVSMLPAPLKTAIARAKKHVVVIKLQSGQRQ